METNRFISIEDVAALCRVGIDVLRGWAEDGLIALRSLGNAEGVDVDDLRDLRGMAELYRELGVNTEGIEIILPMRDRIREMDKEITALRRRVDRLEREQKLRSLDLPRELGLIIDYFEKLK